MPSSDDSKYHSLLRANPITWSIVGVVHTLLTSGIVFGWASLLPILRLEGVNLTPTEYARIFTYGAVGNYLCNLPFGLILDKCGPKICGMTASVLFGVGLVLCSRATVNTTALTMGFTLLGFAGPGVQLPTLHLAKLFPSSSSSSNDISGGGSPKGGGGGAALMMSAQAAAFDGGTAIFALFGLCAQKFQLQSSTFFLLYLFVPVCTFLTAVLVWPNNILPDSDEEDVETEVGNVLSRSSSFVGAGSPFLSSAQESIRSRDGTKHGNNRNHAPSEVTAPLQDAPLCTILSHPPFYCLAFWVSIHILKLNFVVATINDQLAEVLKDDSTTSSLINIFGAMLPFGFVVLPIVASLLKHSPMGAFQLANIIGISYGLTLWLLPWSTWLQCIIVFPSVATSRQIVYSTIFHQMGILFGFRNYGILLGLTNVAVSLTSLVQNPMVLWAENVGTYFGPNFVLAIVTIPLFFVVRWTVLLPSKEGEKTSDSKEILLNNGRYSIETSSTSPRSLHECDAMLSDDENFVCPLVRSYSAVS